jgi:hypothetical protein
MTLFIATIAVPQKKNGAIVSNDITGGIVATPDEARSDRSMSSADSSAEPLPRGKRVSLAWGGSMRFEIYLKVNDENILY